MKQTKKNTQLQPLELNKAWITDIADMYAKGMPAERIAEIYPVPKRFIQKWINEAMSDNPEFQELKEALYQATKKYEISLLNALYDNAVGNAVTISTVEIKDADGNLKETRTTTTQHKPDSNAITALLSMKSKHYDKSKKDNVSINNSKIVNVQIIDNGRPVKPLEIKN